MNDGEAKRGNERTSVGVLAPETDADHIVEAVTDAGGVAETGSVAVVAEDDAVVAVGDAALSALAAAGVSTPVLPVETSLDVSTEPVRDRLERLLAGAYAVRERPVVRVETPEEIGYAVFDVSLMAAEPATISEFTVEIPDESTTTEPAAATGRVARFRADGVVVATPAGSRGYARAAGGPVVVAGSDVAAVVPVAPFATDPDHWVVPLSPLTITVERDVDVTVTVDGRPLSTISPETTVRLGRDGALRVVTPASRPARK